MYLRISGHRKRVRGGAAAAAVALAGIGFLSSWSAGAGTAAALLPDSTLSSMSVDVLLPMKNPALLQRLIQAHMVVSPAKFASLFSTNASQIAYATDWAKDQHLLVQAVDPAAGIVRVGGSTASLEKALRVRFVPISRDHGRQRGVAAVGKPRVGSFAVAVAGLTTTSRLSGTAELQTQSRRSTLDGVGSASSSCAKYWGDHLYPSAKKYSFESNVICGYRPADLTTINDSKSLQGASPTVGIIGWGDDPNVLSLTNQYMSQVGFSPLSKYSKVVDPASQDLSSCDPEDEQAEQAVEIQAVHSVSPNSPIRYYGAASCDSTDVLASFQTAVTDHLASSIVLPAADISEMDLSDADLTAWNRVAIQAMLTGMSVFAASGDSGNGSSVNNDGVAHTSFPASSSYVTSVGGAAVGMQSTGAQPVVAGWEDRTFEQDDATKPVFEDVTSYISGAGGGASQRYAAQPSWQKGITGNITTRAVPDIAGLADPYTGFSVHYTAYDANDEPIATYGTWGGTGLATALVATSAALAKSYSGVDVGLFSPYLYRAQTSGSIRDVDDPGSSGVFYQSTVGTGYVIGFDSKPENLATAKGWDPVTGLGVLDAYKFATWLKAHPS